MSDDTVKGVVQAVKDAGPKKGKYGTQYRISLKVDDEWYGGFFGKSAEALGLEEGKLVTFDVVYNGEYKNIETKTLKVSDSQEAPKKQAASTGGSSGSAGKAYSGGNNAGIKVGHAINNAVQLAIAAKTTDLKSIHGLAVDIIALSVKLEGQFEQIVASAAARLAKASGAEPQQEAPAEQPKAKPAAKAKPAPKKAPPPPPEPEADDTASENDDPPTDPGEPDFDDDIPF